MSIASVHSDKTAWVIARYRYGVRPGPLQAGPVTATVYQTARGGHFIVHEDPSRTRFEPISPTALAQRMVLVNSAGLLGH